MKRKACELLMNIIIDDITAEERKQFEAHLPLCPSCQKELAELEAVWHAVPYTVQPVAAPSDVKQSVMHAVRNKGSDHGQLQPQLSRHPFWRKIWPYPALLGLLLLIIFSAWHNQWFVDDPLPFASDPSELVQEITLFTLDPNPEANGTAWLMRQDEKIQVMINVKDLAPTEEEGIYKVWMVENDDRWYCGAFHINDEGEGVLIYELQPERLSFDAIEITLESGAESSEDQAQTPYEYGSADHEPSGPVVLHSHAADK